MFTDKRISARSPKPTCLCVSSSHQDKCRYGFDSSLLSSSYSSSAPVLPVFDDLCYRFFCRLKAPHVSANRERYGKYLPSFAAVRLWQRNRAPDMDMIAVTVVGQPGGDTASSLEIVRKFFSSGQVDCTVIACCVKITRLFQKNSSVCEALLHHANA